MPDTKWTAFLDEAASADLAPAFKNDGRPQLAVDRELDRGAIGLSLGKKNASTNPLGHTTTSVTAMVLSPTFPTEFADLPTLTSLADLANKMRWKVDDASPDSVVSVLFLAAKLTGAEIPLPLQKEWLASVDYWEQHGLIDQPEMSWPALASALAHQYLRPTTSAFDQAGMYASAWTAVIQFAIETMRSGLPPLQISHGACGSILHRARSALAHEKATYPELIGRSRVFQLRLPVRETTRHQLVDAIFTRETDLTGAMKVFLRTDTNAPLGAGYTLMLLERPELKESKPGYWMTISLDHRANLDLTPLWHELEHLETAAWQRSTMTRASREKESRPIEGIDLSEQPFHQVWWLSKHRDFLASPHRQAPSYATVQERNKAPGSLLTAQEVERAALRTFNPLAETVVRNRITGRDIPILKAVFADDVGSASKDRRRLFAVSWPASDPLPLQQTKTAPLGLFPSAVGALAARTLGYASEEALAFDPTTTEIETLSVPGGYAVVTGGGAFLIDAGRDARLNLVEAKQIFKEQSELAANLDTLQAELRQAANTHKQALKRRTGLSGRKFIDGQKKLAQLSADLAVERATLDAPLSASSTQLASFKAALSRRWNIAERIGEIADELLQLQSSIRTLEELSVLRFGRWVAAVSFPFLIADAAAGPLSKLFFPSVEGSLANEGWMFLVLLVVMLTGSYLLMTWDGGRPDRS